MNVSLPAEPSERRALRSPRWLATLAVGVAGAVLALVTDGVASVVGLGIVGVASVILVSLVFLEVGYSEDRARARGEYGPPPP